VCNVFSLPVKGEHVEVFYFDFAWVVSDSIVILLPEKLKAAEECVVKYLQCCCSLESFRPGIGII
jgi:hypothetical protein